MCSSYDQQQQEPRYTKIYEPPRRSFKSFMAIFVWLSAIHFNFVFIPITLCFIPLRWGLMILASLYISVIIPLYENSQFAQSVTKFICMYAPRHFPITLVVEDMDTFDPNQSYVFGVEPHSILPLGTIVLTDHVGYLPITKFKGFASNAVFRTPVLRHIWSWIGLVPAKMKLILKYLESGYTCAIVPGGIREILYMDHHHEVAFLSNRYGFVKAAICAGSPLVPVYIFGQARVYHWCRPKGKFYEYLSRNMGFTPLAYWGIYGSPIPYPEPLYVAVGKQIPVKKNVEPSSEEVQELHMKFLSALQKLFEEHKAAAGFADTSLIIY